MLRSRYLLIALGVFLALLTATQWQATLAYLGNYLVCSDAPQSADLILVLAGDFYGPRVVQAAELARRGYAPKVLISGTPYQDTTEGEAAIAFLAQQGYRTDSFETFLHHSRSTIEEAIALCPELQRRRTRRVILVTSNYHSRRAAMVFRLLCRHIRFTSMPAADPHYHADRWWADESSRKLCFSEWAKIAGSVLLAYPELVFTNWSEQLRRRFLAYFDRFRRRDVHS